MFLASKLFKSLPVWVFSLVLTLAAAVPATLISGVGQLAYAASYGESKWISATTAVPYGWVIIRKDATNRKLIKYLIGAPYATGVDILKDIACAERLGFSALHHA